MNLDLARWQFAITTVYHFLFVPLTIGLSLLVAGMRDGLGAAPATTDYLRLTKFWGKLFLINFAMGVVTGIVQEFQFGMNWSELLAGSSATSSARRWPSRACWRSSWSRRSSACGSSAGTGCPRSCTCACIWLAAIGTLLSAYFILAANSWMQHPVGLTSSTPTRGRAELTDFGAVLTNSTAVGAFTAHHHRVVRDGAACSCSASARGTSRADSTPRSAPVAADGAGHRADRPASASSSPATCRRG